MQNKSPIKLKNNFLAKVRFTRPKPPLNQARSMKPTLQVEDHTLKDKAIQYSERKRERIINKGQLQTMTILITIPNS